MAVLSANLRRTGLSVLLVLGIAVPAQGNDDAVLTQAALKSAVETHAPPRQAYVKDKPVLAWSLTSDRFEDLPAGIRDALGSVDQTGYTPEYLADNVGSVIALQMDSDGPDFYIIGKSTFDEDYRQVTLDEVIDKNPEDVDRLEMLPDVKALLDARDPALTGVLKTEPVEMIRMSDIGLPEDREVTIASPWGEQTKPAGQQGFLVQTSDGDQYYMVNQGDDGLPLSYVPAE